MNRPLTIGDEIRISKNCSIKVKGRKVILDKGEIGTFIGYTEDDNKNTITNDKYKVKIRGKIFYSSDEFIVKSKMFEIGDEVIIIGTGGETSKIVDIVNERYTLSNGREYTKKEIMYYDKEGKMEVNNNVRCKMNEKYRGFISELNMIENRLK